MKGTMDHRMSIDQYKFFSVHRFLHPSWHPQGTTYIHKKLYAIHKRYVYDTHKGYAWHPHGVPLHLILRIPKFRLKRGNSRADHPPRRREWRLLVHHRKMSAA